MEMIILNFCDIRIRHQPLLQIVEHDICAAIGAFLLPVGKPQMVVAFGAVAKASPP